MARNSDHVNAWFIYFGIITWLILQFEIAEKLLLLLLYNFKNKYININNVEIAEIS